MTGQTRRTVLAAMRGLAIAAASPRLARAAQAVITPRGKDLARALDGFGVETKWQAGLHVDWETGLPDGRPETTDGRHTHCSAFVAAVAKHFGIYILRPPEHGQVLLANAQNEWLPEDGATAGWRSVGSAESAQALANRGELVVASYHNHHDDKPGHIAIIRPSDKTDAEIRADGPEVIQAGTVNSSRISLREGFAGHPAAWRDQEVEFYAHPIAW